MKRYQVIVKNERTGNISYKKEYYTQREALVDFNLKKRLKREGVSVEIKTINNLK